MVVTADTIKQLREETGAGVMECKRALQDSKGDFSAAKEYLKKKGLEVAAKKATRTALQGRIVSYIHHNHKLGVLAEINCETDFVASNEDFKTFCKDIAMHIGAMKPAHIKRDEVDAKAIPENEKPENYYKRTCLLEQPFIRDEKITVGDYLTSLIAKTGENIIIRRFTFFEVGGSH